MFPYSGFPLASLYRVLGYVPVRDFCCAPPQAEAQTCVVGSTRQSNDLANNERSGEEKYCRSRIWVFTDFIRIINFCLSPLVNRIRAIYDFHSTEKNTVPIGIPKGYDVRYNDNRISKKIFTDVLKQF